ncbi:hypothetical protein [Chlamydia vaughanii]|uniref:hypothetical protein n=1 Tax=Chlamydia vaughanii TaxID=3112552 RepID=UPI0032B0FFD8
MCCPCRNSNTPTPPPADNEENIPLSTGGGGGTGVVTSQPSQGPVNSTASRSGDTASGILNQTEDPCCSCSSCLSWLRSCFLSLHPYCIRETEEEETPPTEENPGTPPSKPEKGPDFLKRMRKQHGPMVTQQAMGTCDPSIKQDIENGVQLSEDKKNIFEQRCIEQKLKLEKELLAPLQERLFAVANNPQDLPKPEDTVVGIVKQGFDAKRCYQPPKVRIIIPTVNPKNPMGEKQTKLKTINFTKLEKKLKLVCGMNLSTGQKGPLGEKGIAVSTVLQNSCFFLKQGDKAAPSSDSEELILTEESFLLLIILSMLSAETAPVSPSGKPPGTLSMLSDLMLAIRKDASETGSRASHTNNEGATGGTSEDESWLSPRKQEKLLAEAGKTQKTSQKIIW